MTGVAIVGMSCRYPDAQNPEELWENVIGGRRAFRALPRERLGADYFSSDRAAPDLHYATKAAVLADWHFDRAKFRVSGATYRSTDLTHWLALDTAASALHDAGLPHGEGLERSRTGVLIGNTLTGEFTRAGLMRLRWPYIKRTLGAALTDQGWDDAQVAQFLQTYEASYKSAFPPITEDSLAGGLANTIAGRICNYFDFGGGGYTLDGACSSSILAVANAATALASGQLDAVVAGGVDLSLDPFELVGFAKTGALTSTQMRVYDERSDGFWPGEGCGMVVLMREDDAASQGLKIYATIRGWGYSSDGSGGMTRPEASGHRSAIERAYEMAGYSFDSLGYVEGHGTGTKLGDATELQVFHDARTDTTPDRLLPVGSIKANIGHTKAAAGIAGLIKATLAVHYGVIPPMTGTDRPHPLLTQPGARLRLPEVPEPWPQGPRRVGVSSMGFGGINGHLTLEAPLTTHFPSRARWAQRNARARQDAELLVFAAAGPTQLAADLRSTAARVGSMSYAELGDLACALAAEPLKGQFRAAAIVSDPIAGADQLAQLAARSSSGETTFISPTKGLFLGNGQTPLRLGLMFPGQGAPGSGSGGATARRFEQISALYRARTPQPGAATELAQPRINTATVAGLELLDLLGLDAVGCVGHSLGELASMYWAGAMTRDQILDMAQQRGTVMAAASTEGGAMASLRADAETVPPLLNGTEAVISGFNGPGQTVISGSETDIEQVIGNARQQGVAAVRLDVSHAFHSPHVAPAAATFRQYLDSLPLQRVQREGTFSTVTGAEIPVGTSINAILEQQIIDPVRFEPALRALAQRCDVLVEVGPGSALTGLAAQICPDTPAVSMLMDTDTLSGVLAVAATAFVCDPSAELSILFSDRATRRIDLTTEPTFLASPCESAPDISHLPQLAPVPEPLPEVAGLGEGGQDALQTLRQLLAATAELPLEGIEGATRPLDELHLSSITVTQIAGEAARSLGVTLPPLATNLATASVADIAAILEQARESAGTADPAGPVAGIGPWARSFEIAQHPGSTGQFAGSTGPTPAPGPDRTTWTVLGAQTDFLIGLADSLAHSTQEDGIIIHLAADDPSPGQTLLNAAQQAISSSQSVVVVNANGAAGFARSLYLEHRELPTTVIGLPEHPHPSLYKAIQRDVLENSGYEEITYDDNGTTTLPRLSLFEPRADGSLPVTDTDVILVTGGAGGITLECALKLAQETGCALAIIGRSTPETSSVRAALQRLDAAGVKAAYQSADVTDADSVARAVDALTSELGQVTAIVHGAGVNAPTPIETLSVEEFTLTWATKVQGLTNAVAAVQTSSLKALITFGSVIGRAGLEGEAHYAAANDKMRDMVEHLAKELPECRCLNIEWSVWAGTGMGESLNVLDSLLRRGIQPIPLDVGVNHFLELLATSPCPTTVVVMGRADSLPTLKFEEQSLPLVRFLERPLVHVPGVELITESVVNTDNDPYLNDHVVDGALLFPAVLGMEAMAQVAAALLHSNEPVQLSDVHFHQPVIVPADAEGVTLRTVALVTAEGARVSIRSSETGFVVDHFTALATREPFETSLEITPSQPADLLDLDVRGDLYGSILFQGGPFQSVEAYASFSATSCVARLDARSHAPWFGPHQPQSLALADPGFRDALMHALQVCVPAATLLPAAIATVRGRALPPEIDHLWLRAHETRHEDNTYWYDLMAHDDHGQVYAQWSGLELHAVREGEPESSWPPELIGPHLERVMGGNDLQIVFHRGTTDSPTRQDQRASSARAVRAAGGLSSSLRYRPDGRPLLEDRHVSVSHAGAVTLAVVASHPVGCDLEVVVDRTPNAWTDLLGEEGLTLAKATAQVRGDDLDESASRVWAAREAVMKMGASVTPPALVAGSTINHGWHSFSAGDLVVDTFTVASGIHQGKQAVVAIAHPKESR